MTEVRIKQLVWTEPTEPNNEVRYHHSKADTPLGQFVISWKGWGNTPVYEIEFSGHCGCCSLVGCWHTSLSEARVATQTYFESFVRGCLEPQQVEDGH
jgi:hypothetical protein